MRILVVDDHVLIRDAMRGVLDELQPDALIVEAADCRRTMQLVAEFADLDLVVLDLGLPDADGFAMLKDLRQRYPTLPVVVLSAVEDRESVTRALDLGAIGFIPKSAQRPVMLGALRLVFAGGIYVPPEILARKDSAATIQAAQDHRPRSPEDLGLTKRQMEVLVLMLRGKSNKAICRALAVSEQTVKNHVTAILRAFRVKSRAEAIVVANQFGWEIPLPEA
jgi:DNA-binding NarL/FixJ family response regulator